MSTDPAFPWDDKSHDGSHYQTYPGLTKREYFAALAMQGLCAVPDEDYWTQNCGMAFEEWRANSLTRNATHAVLTADALLAALEAQ